MDENKDGVSLDEWMSYYQTLVDALYKLMDGKTDNVIDSEEYREFWGRWDPPPISVEEARQHIAHMTEVMYIRKSVCLRLTLNTKAKKLIICFSSTFCLFFRK